MVIEVIDLGQLHWAQGRGGDGVEREVNVG